MIKCEECKYHKNNKCTAYRESQIFKDEWGGCWLGEKDKKKERDGNG